MKLLAATNRYYLLLTALLFSVGSGLLYFGLINVLEGEVEERLFQQRDYLTRAVQRTGRLPTTPFEGRTTVSPTPLPEGLRDVEVLEPLENELEPYRQLTFRLTLDGRPYWVSVSKALLETHHVRSLVLQLQLGVLGGLLLGVVLLNRWVARRLWRPFKLTLRQLRGYDVRSHQVLVLPDTPVEEFTQLNRTLASMSQRVAADYTTLKEFTENAAHETRTPLAIMQAKLEQLLQLSDLPAPAAPLVADLYGATQRLARLNQGLTLLSKIDNRQFAEAVPVRLADVLPEKLRQLEDFIQAKQLHLELAIGPGPALRLHPALLDSLVSNLLHNAIRHNHDGGMLRVALSPTELTVANTGPVLGPEEEPTQFFERFRKHHAASDSPGLGLSIVQRIAEYYGFQVRYEYTAADGLHTLRLVF